MAFAPARERWPPLGPRRPWTSEATEPRRPYTRDSASRAESRSGRPSGAFTSRISAPRSAPGAVGEPERSVPSAVPWPVTALEVCKDGASWPRAPFTKQLKPVLTARGPDRLLSKTGAPLKQVIVEEGASASTQLGVLQKEEFQDDESVASSKPVTWEPELDMPRLRVARYRRVAKKLGLLEDSEDESSSSEDYSEETSSYGTSTSSSWDPSGKKKKKKEKEETHAVSPLTLAEVLHEASIGKPVSFRGKELTDAVQQHMADQADFAHHRAECARDAGQQSRKVAARWRDSHQRKQQLCELRWLFQDSSKSKIPRRPDVIHPQDAGRLCTTPVPVEEKVQEDKLADDIEYENLNGAKQKRHERHMQDLKISEMTGSMMTKKSLKDRLKKLNKKQAKEEKKKDKEQGKGLKGALALLKKPVDEQKSDEDGEAVAEKPKALGAFGMFKSLASKAATQEGMEEKAEEKAEQDKPSKSAWGALGKASGINKGGAGTMSMFSLVQKASNVEGSSSGDKHNAGSAAFLASAKQEVVLMQAFTKHDSSGRHKLDQAQALDCLKSLGLRAKSFEERAEVRKILWSLDVLEYNFEQFSQMLPKVRQTLMELRTPRLHALFTSVDSYNRGTLSIAETLDALHLRAVNAGDALVDEALRTFGQMTGRHEKLLTSRLAMLDKASFVTLVCLIQELTDRENHDNLVRIAAVCSLTADEQEFWKYDLISLHAQFHEYNPLGACWGSPSGSLNESQVVLVIRESGYMPKNAAKQHTVKTMISNALRQDGTLGFTDYMKIMQYLKELDKERLRRLIDDVTDKSFSMPVEEVGSLLREIGVITKATADRFEVREVLEDGDGRGTRFLGREEIVVIGQRVHQVLKVSQNARECQYVMMGGDWDESHFVSFRKAFHYFDEDMSEVLERDELMLAMDQLRGNVWRATSNVNLMLAALGLDPSHKIEVNFLSFLRMLKMLDEIEVRRQQGASMGFTRDRTDSLFSSFQALEPESNAVVSRVTLEKALARATAKWCTSSQLGDALKSLGESLVPVNFQAFLRVLKLLEAVVEGDFEECLDDIQRWENNLPPEPPEEGEVVEEEPPPEPEPVVQTRSSVMEAAGGTLKEIGFVRTADVIKTSVMSGLDM